MSIPAAAILGVVLAVATVTDLKSQRIPNWLTFPAMAVLLAYHGLTQGVDGLLFSLSGLGLGLAVMLVPFLMGVMGAGDVKLMAAVGAGMGAMGVFTAFLFTSIAGGLYAFAVLLRHKGILTRLFTGFWNALLVTLGTGKPSYAPPKPDEKLPRLCYGVAIALGSVLAMALFIVYPDFSWIG